MTSKSFDPYEWRSFYFGKMNREEASRILQEPTVEVGTFLLRDSRREGEYSLSVRESMDVCDSNDVRHYLIRQAVDEELNKCLQIGTHCFADLPSMLNFYKLRMLDTCSLTQPYRNMNVTKMMGKWRFVGETDADLSFAQGEELEVMGEHEPGWLNARNAIGRVGRVPADYVGVPEYEPVVRCGGVPLREMATELNVDLDAIDPFGTRKDTRSFPCWARASFSYTPNIYERDKIAVRKRDIIFVTEVMQTGWARGRVYGEGVTPRKNGAAELADDRDEEVVLEEIYADPFKYFERKDKSHVGIFPSSLLSYCNEEGVPVRERSRYGEWKDLLGTSDDECEIAEISARSR